jgi:hypothetical protein
MTGIASISCADWGAFKADLHPVLFGGGAFEEGRYLFRGMRDVSWSLESSFDRYAKAIAAGRRAAEADRLLGLFVEECNRDPVVGVCPSDREESLAVAQHYGLPTRALDWTESPYVASYFAFADVKPGEEGEQAVVWALALDHGAWNGQGATVLRVEGNGNDRVLRQRGAFTFLEASYASLEEHVEACEDEGSPALYRFVIARSEARVALADLRAMGISGTSLFPDRTGAAKTALARCFG